MHRLVALITVAAALVHAPQASAQSTPGLPPAPSSTPGLPPDPAPTPGLPGASTPAPVAPPQVLSASGQVEATIDFAALGLMSSIAIIDARDIGNQNTGTLLVFGGVLGGGAAGYLLTEKFRTSEGQAHFSTTTMMVGAANGILMAQPLGLANSSEEWWPLIVGSTAVGLGGGFALSHYRKPTAGQGTFVATTSLLGVGTAGLVLAATADDDVDLGDGAYTTITLGLDVGAVTGILLAPKVNWSRRRSYVVGASAAVGMLLGSMVGALVAGQADGSAGQTGSEVDPDGIALSMLLGMWGGFAGGVFLTADMPPDPTFGGGPAAAVAPTTPTVSVGPTVLPGAGVGLGAGGQF